MTAKTLEIISDKYIQTRISESCGKKSKLELKMFAKIFLNLKIGRVISTIDNTMCRFRCAFELCALIIVRAW